MPPTDVTFAIIDATVGAEDLRRPRGGVSRYARPIANLPLIGHVLDEVAASGIRHARIVAHPEVRRDVGRVLGAGGSWGLEVSYVEAAEHDTRRVVLSEIEQALIDGPLLLHRGDCLLGDQVTAMCERFNAGDLDVVAAPRRGPKAGSAPPNAAVVDGVAVVGSQTRRVVGTLLSDSEPEGELLAALLSSECRIHVSETEIRWCYRDSAEALLSANRMLLDALPVPPADGSFGERVRVHGRVLISPSAQVSNSVLHGPIAIDADAVVEDSFVGPYTAIGSGARISGTEIDNSMVLADCEISHPGYRIEASVIEVRCQVGRSFDLPKGLHMSLAPGSKITFS